MPTPNPSRPSHFGKLSGSLRSSVHAELVEGSGRTDRGDAKIAPFAPFSPAHPERDCEERAGAVEGWEGEGVGKAKITLVA